MKQSVSSFAISFVTKTVTRWVCVPNLDRQIVRKQSPQNVMLKYYSPVCHTLSMRGSNIVLMMKYYDIRAKLNTISGLKIRHSDLDRFSFNSRLYRQCLPILCRSQSKYYKLNKSYIILIRDRDVVKFGIFGGAFTFEARSCRYSPLSTVKWKRQVGSMG